MPQLCTPSVMPICAALLTTHGLFGQNPDPRTHSTHGPTCPPPNSPVLGTSAVRTLNFSFFFDRLLMLPGCLGAALRKAE
jgi:hypothetical protein